jgi:hypothetical protein
MTWGTGIPRLNRGELQGLDKTESARLERQSALRARRKATWERELALLKKKGGEG